MTQSKKTSKKPAGYRKAARTPVDESGAVWSVALYEGGVRESLTPAQLGRMINDGEIPWDADVWCEGRPDWEPIQNIASLIQDILGSSR